MRHYRPLIVIGIVYVLLAAASAVAVGLYIKSGIDAKDQKLIAGEIAACQRADVQAAKDNRSQRADWIADRAEIRVIAVSSQGRHLTARQQRLQAEFVQPIKAAARTKTWVPLIGNCQAEVARHAAKFFLPQPVAFDDKHHRPPPSVFVVPPPINPAPK